MKGTLFSADFIFDSSDNARLLEINTDTGLTRSGAEFLDFTDFGTLLSDSAFDTLHLIYKPYHLNMVEKILAYVSANVSNITTVTHQEETDCSVYLEAVEDASNKFILRLAYDEGAVLDSTYAKNDCELYNLFNEYGSIGDVVPFYLSSSAIGINVNNLSQSLNSEVFPDFVKKYVNTQSSTNSTLQFLKLGLPDTGSDYRYNLFLEDLASEDDVLITNYIPQVSGSYNTSVRSVQITYGDDLDLCFLGEFESSALLDVPTSLQTAAMTGSSIALSVDNKHKYEFATNYPRGVAGIHILSSIVSSSGEVVKVDLANTGSDYTYKSYFISGSPDSDYFRDLNDYHHSGSTFPSGSHVTSSHIVTKTLDENKERYVHSFTLDSGDQFSVGGGQILPVLDSTGTVITYRHANSIHDGDYLFDENNTSSIIVSSSLIIGDTANEYNLIDPDFEDNDTFLIYGVSRNLLVHNYGNFTRYEYYYSCFVAGTEITLPNGDNVPIEEINEGDEILTYNHDNDGEEPGKVGFIETRVVDKVVKITTDGKYVNEIICTPEHPFYANGKYIQAEYLEVMDLLQTNYGDDVFISNVEIVDETHKVYNLRDVSDNHNFYANNILVHNK